MFSSSQLGFVLQQENKTINHPTRHLTMSLIQYLGGQDPFFEMEKALDRVFFLPTLKGSSSAAGHPMVSGSMVSARAAKRCAQ